MKRTKKHEETNEIKTYFQYQAYLYWLKNDVPKMSRFVTGQELHKSYQETVKDLYQGRVESYSLRYRKFIALFLKGIKQGYIPFEQVSTGPAGLIAFVPKSEECFQDWVIPELHHLNRENIAVPI